MAMAWLPFNLAHAQQKSLKVSAEVAFLFPDLSRVIATLLAG